MFSAFLFDLDGTLVSTIDAYADAVMESFGRFGLSMTKAQFDEWYKAPIHLEGMLASYGLTEEDLPELRTLRDRLYIEKLKEETTWLPGAKEVLQKLSEKYPLALVTGSHRSYVDAIDACLGIEQYFPVIVTADEMGKFMKPHPHGLLLAADRLPVDPKDCLYIGDQEFDMTAAKAAGMTACLVPSKYTPSGARKEADLVCEKLADIPAKFL